jgi:putative FmdB family regulatory protein
MALYQYQCPTCQETFEQFVPTEKRDEISQCPQGHPGVRRLLQSYRIIEPDRRKSFRKGMSRTPGKHFT